ncbi:MAG: ribosome rescue protein RqcH, partial [Methanomicrobiaceae archaeon]|nr:ribosome rescue protein RqcH [Methanomicrobiaceae archaeon]
CFPLLLEGQKPRQQFASFNTALDVFYPFVPPSERKKAGPKLSREERIRRQQEEAVVGFDRKIQTLERVVETIYAHYPLVSEIISALGQARLERSWEEIEAILKASDHSAAEKIQEFHPAESAVTLALDPPAKIVVTESLEANVGRYYEQIKKLKRKKEGALAALARGVAEKPARKPPVSILKPRWFHRFRWMYTSDGVLVVGGRDASQNEELVKRYMEGGDTFVHADVHGGSVVLVKGTTGCMEEAAQFAASYSNAWKSGHFFADVYSAERSQVSKTPESGEYVPHGAFIVRGTRTYFKNVPLGVAIGVQLEPALAVIGGAVAPVTVRTRSRVVLRPGAFEPDDIARKVVRALREQMDVEVQKGLKSVLNTEAVRAFVPPGGSEIVES